MSRVKDDNYNTRNYNISTESNFSSEYAISVKGLRKSFKNLTVLDGIDFDIKKGTIFAWTKRSGKNHNY
jgi:ABC-type transporter Mla maintaining outer membrane lipid asymmetry ATPase subunit MlaF